MLYLGVRRTMRPKIRMGRIFLLRIGSDVTIHVVISFFLRYTWSVRLDLFLKKSGLVKRRTVAQGLCDAGKVLVNGRVARSAKEVKPGDCLMLIFSTRSVQIEILAMPAASQKAGVVQPYRMISEKRFIQRDDA
jgi:ribosomal 50S subunit-recycling heat shock protein